MILSVSRRTDIPAFYADWFYNRIAEGFILIRDRNNAKNVTRYPLTKDFVQAIVFWTKFGAPLLPKIESLQGWQFYIQHTLTSYTQELERNIPPKKEVVKGFVDLSDKIGPDRMIWRYDPIILSNRFTVEYHKRWFEEIARKLAGKTHRCVVSVLDQYPKNYAALQAVGAFAPAFLTTKELLTHFVSVASSWGITVEACAEEADFRSVGVNPTKCIDDRILYKLVNSQISSQKDRSQRAACGCVESFDIGANNTCPGGCVHCYAQNSKLELATRQAMYCVDSPMFCDRLRGDEIVRDAPGASVQIDMFA